MNWIRLFPLDPPIQQEHEVQCKQVGGLRVYWRGDATEAVASLPCLLTLVGVCPPQPLQCHPKEGWQQVEAYILLFSLHGSSVNDGIDSAFTSICYSSIDDAVRIIQFLGNGTLMAKLDIKAAYHLVPVNLEDRLLLGTRWEESIFVDTKF